MFPLNDSLATFGRHRNVGLIVHHSPLQCAVPIFRLLGLRPDSHGLGASDFPQTGILVVFLDSVRDD